METILEYSPTPELDKLQEAQNLQRHLNHCKKTPRISDGEQTIVLHQHFDLNDALRIRAESGQ